ncbi:MAG TPA: histidinol-phosphate transaminase, partial [Thermoanaerobaculia bacterium]|nr:histidinol-phosphate transaminase [Thermoanaerobaculia bacterium]
TLAPYVPGRPIEEVEAQYGIHGAVKLASNENPLGPSPKAVEAATRALADVNRYPDGSGTFLKRAISARYGVPVGQIVLGAGGSELIDITVRTYVEPGDEVVVPQGIFRMFPVATHRAGGALVEVPSPFAGLKPDLPALLRRIGEETKIVAIANPNNPTGTYVSREELDWFVARVPPGVLLFLDEAYFEFADEVVPDYPNGLAYLARGVPIVVLRTFSKIVGLAGLRIGYGFAAADVAAALEKVREPFNTTSVAQAAAIAALADDEHRWKTRALVVEERAFLFRELLLRGLSPWPSVANFLLVETPVPFAPLESEFARRGVILRPMGAWGFPRGFRVSVGTHAENLRFLGALDEIRAAGLLRGDGASR